MKTMLIAALLAWPCAAAAMVATEPQQATQSLSQGKAPHRQLFEVRYILRLAPAEPAGSAMPDVVMERGAPEIAPPSAGTVPALMLGVVHRDPNTIICYGWGCETEGH
jgi:hypothetical protein